MEDIGGETREDVAMWEVLPEWVDKLYALFRKCWWLKSLQNTVDQLKCLGQVSERGENALAKILHGDKTLQASIFHATSDQTLLGMVRNIGSKDRKDSTEVPVCANHINTLLSSFDHGSQNMSYAMMEQAVLVNGTGRFLETLKFLDRNVADENRSMFRTFSSCFLLDIPQGKVYGPHLFVSLKAGQPRLV